MFLPLQLCAMARRAVLLLGNLLTACNVCCIATGLRWGRWLTCVVRRNVAHVLLAECGGDGFHAAAFASLVTKLQQLIKDRQLWLRSQVGRAGNGRHAVLSMASRAELRFGLARHSIRGCSGVRGGEC